MWGKTVTIELDHSDFDLSELMEIFKGLTIASGFEMSSWNNVIKSLSADIHDTETEDLKEKLNEWKDEVDDNEWKDLRHNTTNDGLDEWKQKNGFGSSTGDSKDKAPFKEFGDEDDEVIDDIRHRYLKDSEGYESMDELENDFFGPEEERNIDAVEEMRKYAEGEMERRMDIIGQNGNEGTHYDDEELVWGNEDEDTNEDELKDYKGIHITHPTYDWDNETNEILHNINDSITIIKDRMEDIDMRMDNIDEQIGVLNADVANIEFGIAFPPPNEHILQAKGLYDRAVKVHERDKEWRKDVVDMETGEVTNDSEVSVDGGFDGKKLNKSVVKKGKIKDLKK
jgi:hypothetical protein